VTPVFTKYRKEIKIAKLMEKLGPFLAYMLMFSVLLIFSRLCLPFFAVFSFF